MLRPATILFLTANPRGKDNLAVDKEIDRIRDALRRSARRDEVAHELGMAIDKTQLMRLLVSHRPLFLHFAGHGTADGVVVEGASISAEELATMLRSPAGRDVRVAVLNACYSHTLAATLCQVVDCVVGMEGPVDDEAACAFAIVFHTSLACGDSVADAFANAVAVMPPALAAAATVNRDVVGATPSVAVPGPRLSARDGVDPAAVFLLGTRSGARRSASGGAEASRGADRTAGRGRRRKSSTLPRTWEERLVRRGMPEPTVPVPAVELATALLKISIRDDPGAARAELSKRSRAQRADALAIELATILDREQRDGRVSIGIMRELLTKLEAVSGRGGLRIGTAALVAARAVDVRFGPEFREYFRRTRRLRRGDPFPVAPGVQPEAMFDRLDHLAIAPEAVEGLRIRVVVDDELRLDGAMTLAAAVTNAVIEPELTWLPYERGAERYFYGVGPADEWLAIQRTRISRAVELARDAGVDVLVFPELVTTDALLDELIDAKAFAGIPFVVAGSYHEPGPPQQAGRNVTVSLADGERLVNHHKFTLSARRESDGRDRYEDLLAPEHEAGFDLVIGRHGSAVVLTRQDAHDGEVAALVRHLTPTVVAVVGTQQHGRGLDPLRTFLNGDHCSSVVVACAGGDAGMRRAGAEEASVVAPLLHPALVRWIDGSDDAHMEKL